MRRALSIAGWDPTGGAGLAADLKTFHAWGVWGAGVLTASTEQDTRGARGVHALPEAHVRAQVRSVLDDVGADAAKCGLLTPAAARVVAQELPVAMPLVLDPVLAAHAGGTLGDVAALRALLPRATLVTPNAPEAEALTGLPVRDAPEQVAAAEALRKLGAGAVLLKGGHIAGPVARDLLLDGHGARVFEHPRSDDGIGHGAGCTLSAAIAAGIALGLPLRDAVARAAAYVQDARAAAPRIGRGRRPAGHPGVTP